MLWCRRGYWVHVYSLSCYFAPRCFKKIFIGVGYSEKLSSVEPEWMRKGMTKKTYSFQCGDFEAQDVQVMGESRAKVLINPRRLGWDQSERPDFRSYQKRTTYYVKKWEESSTYMWMATNLVYCKWSHIGYYRCSNIDPLFVFTRMSETVGNFWHTEHHSYIMIHGIRTTSCSDLNIYAVESIPLW
jgi:hypothetical protein